MDENGRRANLQSISKYVRTDSDVGHQVPYHIVVHFCV